MIQPEHKLILAAILLTVAEQKVEFVTRIKRGKNLRQTERIKTLTQQKALQFIQTEEFETMCNIANIDAAWMRSLDPEKANKLLIRLMDFERGLN